MCALAGAFSAADATALTAASRADIACPPAPPGWTASATNPSIWGPNQNPGQHTERVACDYAKGSKRASIVMNFALPSDPNPYYDFDYGCSTKDQAWNPNDRVYAVMSRTHWGFAQFEDSTHQLDPGDVAGFEAATRAFLKGTEGFGHGCKVITSQTGVTSLFLFYFEYSEVGPNLIVFGGINRGIKGNRMIPAGSFTTLFNNDGSGSTVLAKVARVSAPPIQMTVVEHGKKHNVFLRIDRGIDFATQGTWQRLRVGVRVDRSNYPSCRQGAQGTMTISTHQFLASTVGPSTVDLELCGTLFHRGSPKVTASIVNG